MNEWVCVSFIYVCVLRCQVEMQWAEVLCVVDGGQSKRGSDTLENSLKGLNAFSRAIQIFKRFFPSLMSCFNVENPLFPHSVSLTSSNSASEVSHR